MATIHTTASISPTKPEILEAHLGGPVEILGTYRFDDPEGEVGVEAFVLCREGATRHVVLTYRGAALAGAEDHLLATMQHTELGPRWVYAGAGDPVARDCFRRAIGGEQDQAELEMWADGELVGVREGKLHLTPLPAPDGATGDTLTILTDLDAPLEAEDVARLEVAWDGGHATVATFG